MLRVAKWTKEMWKKGWRKSWGIEGGDVDERNAGSRVKMGIKELRL